jgi:hypothetical protein
MGSHPINLALRFLLELAALSAMGVWGWRTGKGGLRFVLALGIPLVAALLWGTLAVPGDPSRSGNAPVPVPGLLRILLELATFGFATWSLFDVEFAALGWAMGVLVVLHYLASIDRILWLVKQ